MLFTPESIRSRIREQPFVPVRLVLSTGQTYDIFHPDLVMVGERSLEVGLPSKKNPAIFQQVTRIAILHLTEMLDLPVPAQPSGNGPT